MVSLFDQYFPDDAALTTRGDIGGVLRLDVPLQIDYNA